METKETTLSSACDRYLLHLRSTRNLSPHTIRAYECDLRHFRRYTKAGALLQSCDKAHLESYVHHLQNECELKPATVKRRLACLRLFFTWAEDENLLTASPFNRLRIKIRLPRTLPRSLTRDEIRRLILYPAKRLGIYVKGRYEPSRLADYLEDSAFRDLTTLLALEILFATGIRVGELVRIRLKDLDQDGHSILIRGKGSRERTVFLPDSEIKTLLKRYLAIRGMRMPHTSNLLIKDSGGAITEAMIRRQVSRAAEHAKLCRRVTPHMIRHSTATCLLEAGIDIRYVQSVLGHASIVTTQRYTAVNTSHLIHLINSRHPRQLIISK